MNFHDYNKLSVELKCFPHCVISGELIGKIRNWKPYTCYIYTCMSHGSKIHTKNNISMKILISILKLYNYIPCLRYWMFHTEVTSFK